MAELLTKNNCPHCHNDERYMHHENYGGIYLMHQDIVQCPSCRQYYWMTYHATSVRAIEITPTKSLDFFEPLEGESCPDCGETLYVLKNEGLNYKVFGSHAGTKYCGNTEILMPTGKIIRESICHYTDPRRN